MCVVMTPWALAAVLQDGGAGAIAEEHAGVAISPVRDRAQLLRADHEHRVVGVRGDELLRDLEGEKEAGARGGHVEAGGVRGADLGLHKTGRRREDHVRRGRGDEDQVDLFRGEFACSIAASAAREAMSLV